MAPDAAARAVHRHDHGALVPDVRGGDGGCRRSRERLALARPDVEPAGAHADRCPQRRHRFPGVEREHRGAANRRRLDQRGMRHHGVGLELTDRLDELAIVGGRAHDASAAASIEEVHDLLGDVVRLEGEHHPSDFRHDGPSSTERGQHRAARRRAEEVRGRDGARPRPPHRGEANVTGSPRARSIPEPADFRSGRGGRRERLPGDSGVTRVTRFVRCSALD